MINQALKYGKISSSEVRLWDPREPGMLLLLLLLPCALLFLILTPLALVLNLAQACHRRPHLAQLSLTECHTMATDPHDMSLDAWCPSTELLH